MRVQRYSSSLKDQWDKFIQRAKNATFLFNRDYMDYHSSRFEDFSLVIYNKDKIIALLPANKIENTIYSHQGLSYGGVITLPKTTLQETTAIYIALLDFLNTQRIETLQLKAFPTFYSSQPTEETDYLLHLLQAKKTRCDSTLAINQADKIGNNTNKKRKIKYAQQQGLTIKASTDFNSFWNDILIPNLKEVHGLTPVHSLTEIERLQRRFPENIQLHLVYKKDALIAGTVMYITNNVAHSQYISANKEGKETGALDFLFNHLIEEVYIEKPVFDFGIVNQDQGINWGLTFWKEAFGARTYCHNHYEIDTKNSSLLQQIL